ncbi:AAA family ATPase, partial [bacterium]|nr:AAA family ATPase [bacterium]
AGTTTVAANVSAALARHAGVNVAILDLNFQFGDIALQMNVKNRYSILDMIGRIDQVDARVLKDTLLRNAQNITLLSGPSRIEDAEHIDCGHLDQILSLFRHVFEFILIDTNHVLNDITIKALDESDHVLVVAAPDVPTICNTTRCLDLFKKMGYDREKVLLVLNRFNRLGEIDNSAMEKLLEYPVFWRLPNHEDAGMAACLNKGIPILRMAPRSKLSESFIRMSEHLNGTTAPPDKKRKKQKRQRFLKKLIP